MTRALVLGLEAVLADGTVLSSMNRLIKNNTGYDLKQLFIGAEGTLGLITRVVLRLIPKPAGSAVGFCALPDFTSVTEFLKRAQSRLSAGVSAFEVLWTEAYDLTVAQTQGLRPPVATGHPFYLLLETMGGDPVRDREQLEEVLSDAFEDGLLLDAVIAKSEAETANIWLIRDGMPEATAGLGPRIGFDVSLELKVMQQFTEELPIRLAARWPESRLVIFGHLGDGNLHLVVTVGPDTLTHYEEVEDLVYQLTGELGGSVSAEHGIGFAKRAYLKLSRSPAEIEAMRRLKRAFDPNNILNPGRIFELDG